jgi:hypothetical protein
MNLFRVDFIQGKRDASDFGHIVHQITDLAGARKIITLSLSPEKMNSEASNWVREPRRCVFEMFTDAWFTERVLSGDYEHPRNICHYEVSVYRDNIQIFSGIIDTSVMSYEPANRLVKVTCYDKLRLLSVFSDLKNLYSDYAGYQPGALLLMFIGKIEYTIPIRIPRSISAFSAPEWSLSANQEILRYEFPNIALLPSAQPGWSYGWDSSSFINPVRGFWRDGGSNHLVLFVAMKRVVKLTGADSSVWYQGRYYARIVKLFNNIAPYMVAEYEKTTDWITGEELPDASAEFENVFNQAGYNYNTYIASGNLQTSILLNGTFFDAQTVTDGGRPVGVLVVFAGPVLPKYLHPGKSYETQTLDVSDQVEGLKVVQAMLMLYNATLVCTADDILLLKSRSYDPDATPIAIATTDIISMTLAREAAEVPNMEALSVYSGDTSILQRIVRPFIASFHESRWKANVTIHNIDGYQLQLHSIITIQGNNYVIVSVQRDYTKNQYEVIAWML